MITTRSRPRADFPPNFETTSALDAAIRTENLRVSYGPVQALKSISLRIAPRRVTTLIGPSGCGKSTFLRAINRMLDLAQARVEGTVTVLDQDIYSPDVDVVALRRRVGMVFQMPNPFPKSIFENVVYGLRRQGINDRGRLEEIAEDSLRRAALWNEVKDRLHHSALSLSGGQQQRLCIARSLAVEPEILLMDEPTAALDPIAARAIEELIVTLKDRYTLLVVTHNMQQAARISDYTAFFLAGELVELDKTEYLFRRPSEPRTLAYITGRFG